MTKSAQPDVRFGEVVDRESCHQPYVGFAELVQFPAEQHGVDDRAEHPDVVRLDAVDTPVLGAVSPEDVPAADDDSHLDTGVASSDDFAREMVQPLLVEPE